jgi:hypothetical protein
MPILGAHQSIAGGYYKRVEIAHRPIAALDSPRSVVVYKTDDKIVLILIGKRSSLANQVFADLCGSFFNEDYARMREAYVDKAIERKLDVFQDIVDILIHFRELRIVLLPLSDDGRARCKIENGVTNR